MSIVNKINVSGTEYDIRDNRVRFEDGADFDYGTLVQGGINNTNGYTTGTVLRRSETYWPVIEGPVNIVMSNGLTGYIRLYDSNKTMLDPDSTLPGADTTNHRLVIGNSATLTVVMKEYNPSAVYFRFYFSCGTEDNISALVRENARIVPLQTVATSGEMQTLSDDVSDLKSALEATDAHVESYETFEQIYSPTNEYVIYTNVGIGNVVDPTPVASSSYRYQIAPVKKGEKFKITGTAEVNNYRLWAFTDTTYHLLAISGNNASITDAIIFAPDDGYLMCNFKSSASKDLYKADLTVDILAENTFVQVTALTNESENEKAYGNVLAVTSGYIINTSGEIGATVDTTPVSNSSHRYQILAVKKGDSYKISGKSTTPSGRLWAFTDTAYKLLAHADSLANVTDLVLYAPSDGYIICNFSYASGTTHILLKGFVREYSPLQGKKVAWYGDSMIQNNWWKIVADHYSMQSTNCGVSGTKISGTDADSMCQTTRITGTSPATGNAIPTDADFIIIGAGTNDWAQNVPLGEKSIVYDGDTIVEDVTTFYQACHVMFRRLATLRPDTRVIVLGTPFGKISNRSSFANAYGLINGEGLTSLDYEEALCSIAEMWGHYSIRYGRKMEINDNNVAALLDPTNTDSHLHPTIEASKNMFRNAAYSGLSYLKEL